VIAAELDPASSTRAERVAWALRAAIVLAVGIVYANALGAAFVFDDLPGIVERAEELSGSMRELVARERRPVVALTLAANHRLGGLDPWGYHAFNVAVHGAAALVLFGLVRRVVTRQAGPVEANAIAFAAALLFAVHPLQTEAVTYVIQRAESTAALCMLVVLAAIERAERSPRPAAWSVLAVVACAAGMASKATMVMAPPLAFAFDALIVSSSARAALRARWGVHAALASTWLLLVPTGVAGALWDAAGRPDAAVGFGVGSVTWVEYLASQPGVILRYVSLAAWPSVLCIDYRWPVATGAGVIVPAMVVGLALVVVLVLALRRHPLAFCGLVFFGWLAPTSSFVPIRDLAVEHRMYLPLAALAVPAVVVAWWWGKRVRAGGLVALILLAGVSMALGARTIVRNRDYATPVALWTATVDVVPTNRRARLNLGVALREAGRTDEAIDQLARVVAEAPGNPRARLNYGAALVEAGRPGDAAEHLLHAAERYPRRVDVALLLGDALRAANRPDDAVEAYRRAAEIEPVAAVFLALGNALDAMGRPDDAAAAFEASIAQATEAGNEPLRAAACFNLGNVRFRTGAFDEAITMYESALEARPDHAGAREWLHRAREQRDR
jgi:Tfp pilus assembly protein PilF